MSARACLARVGLHLSPGVSGFGSTGLSNVFSLRSWLAVRAGSLDWSALILVRIIVGNLDTWVAKKGYSGAAFTYGDRERKEQDSPHMLSTREV